MRNLFFLLLLANLLFLGWQLWIAPPDVEATRLLSAGKEQDVSVTLAAAPPAPAAGGAPAEGAGCTRLGPIADGQVADTLRARLAGTGIGSTMVTEEGQVWVGHWVQIESAASREEADRAVARLAAGGIPDAYVLQNSPPFSISLGVFRDRQRADAVTKTATGLGFRPQVTDRYRAGLQYWLTFTLPSGRSLPLEDLVRESGQILRVEQATCPAPIGGTGAIN